MTDEAALSVSEIIERLAEASEVPPFDILRQAAQRWSELAEPLLRTLAEAGETVSPEADSLACWAIYIAAHKCDPRALPLLCALAAWDTRLEEIIGDGTTMDVPAILVRTYDGDPAPLRRLIENEKADELLRAGALTALAWLTMKGRIARDETAAYLRWLYDHMEPRDNNFVWAEWAIVVVALGLEDLMPRVEEAFRTGWADEGIVELKGLRDELAGLKAGTDPFEILDPHLGPRINEMDDLVAFVSSWRWETPQAEFDAALVENGPQGRVISSGTTYHNPYRNVGRNDPCPCGSGKKFKKCCLAVAE
jgi:hypothetical protein